MTNDVDGAPRLEPLVRRLLEHAECHENVEWQDDEQRQWAEDLRNIAWIAQRLFVLATKHCPDSHHDWETIKHIADGA